MKRFAIAALLFTVTLPAVAKTHSENYNMPCSTLWQAVRDTVRNSGKYGIIGIDSTEMTASFNIGGNLTAKRINSVVLNTKGNGCEMQIQTAFSGLVNNDAGDFKKRVDASITKLNLAPPAATEGPKQTSASPQAQ